MGNTKSLFHPDLWVGSVTDIAIDSLQAKGIRGLILDLDETLVAAIEHTPSPQVSAWIQQMKSAFSLYILSNNRSSSRVRRVAEELHVPFSHLAAKPRRRGFRTALSELGLEPQEVAIVGDQVFTDILGGNRLGAFTILATPIAPESKLWRKIMRACEGIVLREVKAMRQLVRKEPS